MANKKKIPTVQVAERLVRPVLDELGLELWDVRFEKEGATWYLRYLIDRDGGVSVQDCEAVNKAVDKLLDQEDPIDQSYVLEVSSPGIERELVKDWHFERYAGEPVSVRLIRPVDGVRDFSGELKGKVGDEITIVLEEDLEMTFLKAEAAYIRLYVDFESGGLEG